MLCSFIGIGGDSTAEWACWRVEASRNSNHTIKVRTKAWENCPGLHAVYLDGEIIEALYPILTNFQTDTYLRRSLAGGPRVPTNICSNPLAKNSNTCLMASHFRVIKYGDNTTVGRATLHI